MNVLEAYTHWSAGYDSVTNPTRDLDHQLMQRVFAGRSFGRVLELGCGTGKNTALLTGIAQRLVAMDFSPGMLQAAKRKLAHLPEAHVRFVQADITQPWPLDDAKFDLVCCNLVLEHVQDLQPVFAQARRALADGGIFFVSELHPARQYLGTQARFMHLGREQKIPAFMHHMSDYTKAAAQCGLRLIELNECWDAAPEGETANAAQSAPQAPAIPLGRPPRLVSFMFGL